jgi:hypothetical protein
VLGPDEVVLVLGCMLLLYVGMFKSKLWCSSVVGLMKWIYTTKQGTEGFFSLCGRHSGMCSQGINNIHH